MIQNPLSVRNRIQGNLIHSNGGLAIDLGNNGVTANDTDDVDTGANGFQNYPILFSGTPGSERRSLDF